MLRSAREIWPAQGTLEGAGVKLHRAFGHRQAVLCDPFLMLDDFRSSDPRDFLAGFPWHPHRGIETVTYVLDGRIEHQDSLGNKGVIGGGEVQWMTAGRGIVHSEMPQHAGGRLAGFQLWLNLPRAEKLSMPRYLGVGPGDIPLVERDEAAVHVIAGAFDGHAGPVRDLLRDARYLDVTLRPRQKLALEAPPRYTALVYVVDGEASVGPRQVPARSVALLSDGDGVELVAGEAGARALFLCGRPLAEPIAWYGPVVMNTQEELVTAFREYEAGTFVRP